jgi:outer membrane lipoprotein-sorting protein
MNIRFAALATLAALSLAAQPPPAGELKLDDIIKKSVDAQGGLDKMKAIKTLKSTGKMIIGGGQMEAPVTAYMKRPGSNRMEISIQGQKIVEAFDGTTKWMINPLMGGKDPQKAPGEDTKMASDDADGVEGPLVNYKEKGNAVELLGKEEVDGNMAYKLKVTLKSGNVRTIFLDEKSFLTVKMVSKVKQMGQEFEAEAFPANYKPVEGVMMPFSMEMKVNKQVGMQMQFEKIEANVPLDDSLFSMPAAEVKKADPPKVQ